MVPSVSMMKCAHVPGYSPRCFAFEANVLQAAENEVPPVKCSTTTAASVSRQAAVP